MASLPVRPEQRLRNELDRIFELINEASHKLGQLQDFHLDKTEAQLHQLFNVDLPIDSAVKETAGPLTELSMARNAVERVVAAANEAQSLAAHAKLAMASGSKITDWVALGFAPATVERLQMMIEAAVDERVEQRLRSSNAMERITVLSDDPMHLLSAVELGKALGLSDESVRNRERAGEVFSILRPSRKRGREYPVFQSWPGIAGQPLSTVLVALKPLSATDIHDFFASSAEPLGGLTPVEVMRGALCVSKVIGNAASALLRMNASIRLAAVLDYAKEFAGIQPDE